jgi:hypothetical protein
MGYTWLCSGRFPRSLPRKRGAQNKLRKKLVPLLGFGGQISRPLSCEPHFLGALPSPLPAVAFTRHGLRSPRESPTFRGVVWAPISCGRPRVSYFWGRTQLSTRTGTRFLDIPMHLGHRKCGPLGIPHRWDFWVLGIGPVIPRFRVYPASGYAWESGIPATRVHPGC